MTKEEREKAIDALKISTPIMAMTQEKFNDYIQTLNKIMDWLEQEPCEDAISRQYLIEKATNWEKHFHDSERYVSLTDIQNAPPVKPQEPFNIDTYCKEHFMVMVDKDVWEKSEKALKQEPILDKIRAEIVEMWQHEPCAIESGCLDEVLEVIDKYKAESEEKT